MTGEARACVSGLRTVAQVQSSSKDGTERAVEVARTRTKVVIVGCSASAKRIQGHDVAPFPEPALPENL